MSQISDLRALAKKRHRAATAKVSRLRNKGVELGGTKYDTRVPVKDIDKMNSRQLRSHIRKLNQLTDRKTSFVGGSLGVPIPSQKWNQYKAAEVAVNMLAKAQFDSVKNKTAPNRKNMTVEDVHRMTTANSGKTAFGDATHTMFDSKSRTPNQITSEEGLEKLTQQMKNKLRPKYKREFVKSGREEFNQMLDTIGKSELRERVKGLSDNQFNLLWSFGGFANNLSLIYEAYKARAKEGKDSLYASQVETSFKEIDVAIDWASNLPIKSETQPTRRTTKSPRRNKSNG